VKWPEILALVVVGIVLVRTAWVCDDAYITFRTIDNFLHGHGLRWNVAERVQSFTHPLWLILLTPFIALTGEPYYTTLVVSVTLTLATLAFILRCVSATPQNAVIAVSILLFSRAFIEYSTSGLENPLSHLLLTGFFYVYLTRPLDRRTVAGLSFLASLLALNRLDSAVLVALPLLHALVASRRERVLIPAVIAFLPFIGWEVFSVLYYGFPFPNTAYAKLNTGTPPAELAMQGFLYLAESAGSDPLTLAVVAAACVASIRRRGRETWAVAGILMTLVYVVRVGGDFMSGRFLTAPFIVAVVLLAVRQWQMSRAEVVMALSVVVLAGAGARQMPFISGSDFGYETGQHRAIAHTGITDERQFYYRSTGLLRALEGSIRPPDSLWVEQGMAARTASSVTVRGDIGFFGYFAGPRVFIIDYHALADPLLAHLPALARWRVGHFVRRLPDGYEASVIGGRNAISDPAVAAYYDKLQLITRGPVLDRARLRALVDMNLGRYDRLLKDYGWVLVPTGHVVGRRAEGAEWDSPGTVPFLERGVRVVADRPIEAHGVELTLSGDDDYTIAYLLAGHEVGRQQVTPDVGRDGTLKLYLLKLPPGVVRLDEVKITGRRGDFRYSLGHLRII
jgi:arabinofuranosyltransferase